MKSKLIYLVLFSFALTFCKAQDTAVLVSTSMFDKSSEQILLAGEEGWIFKQGNDTAWARKDIDVTGWKKLKPIELSANIADKNGKAEGWFRIKVKPDSSFKNHLLNFKIESWAAIDFYVDGNLVSSYGNTGVNGKPFKEQEYTFQAPVPVNLTPENEHIIALHFVDYVAPLPPRHLKSEDMPLQHLIRITSPDFNSFFVKGVRQVDAYMSMWISVCAILSILFWLLYFQNKNEKNLRLIAVCVTCYALATFSLLKQSSEDISYTSFIGYSLAQVLFFTAVFISIPIILARIFKRKISRFIKAFLIIFFIVIIGSIFLSPSSSLSTILLPVLILALISVCLYYIISSWKKLKGAQWAIVAGLLVSLLSILIAGFLQSFFVGQSIPNFYLILSAFILSFPLSLLVYVAMRFKEFIKEVQQNAQQVVQLSEEKKLHALEQKQILEEEVARQTVELRSAFENLKSTQSQLIQSEKMASLGELTAGIAHEIQNPLNFVNNFSEVNDELIEEVNEENDVLQIKIIVNDIKQNNQKISFHGKRADSIVKSMMQHSRISSGHKEPTDINALCDEYLRLSYHGMRAKDKNFNAEFKTDFDESIQKINIISQDIGRVLLNLFNNAFYAVNEKKKTADEKYKPCIEVKTEKLNDKIEIRVSDNGNGIPQKVIDKIFQPFFTTKPTGEGTGLGLSLSYDIIKAHGGEIKVETKESEGTEFIIQLPII